MARLEEGHASPSVLEVGRFPLFKRVDPLGTHWCYTGDAARLRALGVVPDSIGLDSLARELATRRYELIVCFALPADRLFSRIAHALFSRRRAPADPSPALARHRDLAPIAVLDVEDGSDLLDRNVPLLDLCTAYFKRELSEPRVLAAARRHGRGPQGDRFSRLHAIPIGLSAQRVAALPAEPPPKTVDVFFAGTFHRGLAARERGRAELESLRERGFSVEIAERLPLEEYLARCARAWLVWSPPGIGEDCFRHYEAAAAGSVPVIGRMTIRRHRPLVEGEHCFFYDDRPGALAEACASALADRERLLAMAAAGRAFVLAHHTHAAICRYVREVCRAAPVA